MAVSLKRARSPLRRSISPPALRRKLQSAELTGVIPSNCIREHVKIMSWNVNGVGPLMQKSISFEHTPSLCPLRTFLRKHDWPDILCLQEVKISGKDPATQRRLQQAANEGRCPDEPEYRIVFSLPRDEYNAIGFGGKVHGVASLIRNDTKLRISTTRKPDWDLEGRILIHETSNNLVIMNGYWVNGTTAPYRNPLTGAPDEDRHALKLRYHQYVLDLVLKYQRQGCQVLLVGDMNVARERIDGHPNLRTSPIQHVINRHDFNQKFFEDSAGMNGVDLFRYFHKNSRKYSYRPRNGSWGFSMDRVDLIIGSSPLVEHDAVVGTDICDSHADRGHSDHVPLWVLLDLEKIPVRRTAELQATGSPTSNNTKTDKAIPNFQTPTPNNT